jgi:hypothetical protein
MVSIFTMADKIEGFKRKLEIWEGRIHNKCFFTYPNLISIVDKNVYIYFKYLIGVIASHSRALSEHCSVNFSPNDDQSNGYEWVRNPFD